MADHEADIRVQVMGSGGPMHAGGRGNSAYVVRRGSRAILAIDMGGDTPTALARAGILPAQIPLLALSHVHPDHVSGLPDFLWGEITAGRSTPLTVIGPPSAADFHDAETLFRKLFSSNGAFPDLAGLMEGKPFALAFEEASGDGRRCFKHDDLHLFAMRVNHGAVPALAFRLEVDGTAVVFAGDQTMDDSAFITFSQGADLMIAHAIANATIAGTPLEKSLPFPEAIGRAAQEAGVRRLILSHWLGAPKNTSGAENWSLSDQADVLAAIAAYFDGPISVASDLDSFSVGGDAT